jgi:hypothetical protein
MQLLLTRVCCLVAILVLRSTAGGQTLGTASQPRHRVLVSTDIGGTDPDDFQSFVHLLSYADSFDLEGLVSSPYGPGRKEHILRVIDCYAKDYEHLRSHSARYPTADALRAIAKQGAIETNGPRGFGEPTEGSNWIVSCARREDDRSLYVLVWGGIDDLAQALHDAPDIVDKLRVYFIGGPNKMWSASAFDYIEVNHPRLWMIEANSTYRGWFVGGNQGGEWGNKAFVAAHVASHGALGDFFASQLGGTLKMGDSPSVGWLLRGKPEDPSQPSWGGQFVRVWEGRKTIFRRFTSEADEVEVFGIVQFELPLPAGMTLDHHAKMIFDNRVTVPMENDGRALRCCFSPRDAKIWSYVIRTDFPALDGQSGKFTATAPPADRTSCASTKHPNWWTDDPNSTVAEGIHPGAKSVNCWREEFLTDFAARLRRVPRTSPQAP